MRGGRKWFFLALTHLRLRRSPLSRRARIIFWEDGFCDFAFGSAQNDRSEAYCEGWKFSAPRSPSKRKSVAMCIDFGLMLCALVLGWCCKHWYWIDVVCTGFALILSKLIFKRFVSLRKNQGYSFCNVCRSTLKWTGFCPNLSPHPHVILHAGLARSCRIHCFNLSSNPI